MYIAYVTPPNRNVIANKKKSLLMNCLMGLIPKVTAIINNPEEIFNTVIMIFRCSKNNSNDDTPPTNAPRAIRHLFVYECVIFLIAKRIK